MATSAVIIFVVDAIENLTRGFFAYRNTLESLSITTADWAEITGVYTFVSMGYGLSGDASVNEERSYFAISFVNER